MSKINDGGPAFPHIDFEELRDGAASYTHPAKGGMTLRDYFAAKVTAAFIAHAELVEDGVFLYGPSKGEEGLGTFAVLGYIVADRMLEARKMPNVLTSDPVREKLVEALTGLLAVIHDDLTHATQALRSEEIEAAREALRLAGGGE